MYKMRYELIFFEDDTGRYPFENWINSIKDSRILARIGNRLDRLETGNLGDYKKIDNDIYELRLFFGPGYRIYFGIENKVLVVLLCGGNKSTQTKDIKKAKQNWSKFKSKGRE